MLKTFAILSIFVALSSTVSIKSEEKLVTESPLEENLNSTESFQITESASEEVTGSSIDQGLSEHVYTKQSYELKMTIKGSWVRDYNYKNSKIFQDLSKELDGRLTDLIENFLTKNLSTKNVFKLRNVRPSSLPEHLYVTVTYEEIEEIFSDEFHNLIENQINIYRNIYSVEASLDGLSLQKIDAEKLNEINENTPCASEFCKDPPLENLQTEVPEIPETTLEDSTPELSSCRPKDTINRDKTSVYIFESQQCLSNVQNSLKPHKCNSKSVKKRQNDEKDGDEMIAAASELHHQIVTPTDDDEIIVVVKKKGDKVLIEF